MLSSSSLEYLRCPGESVLTRDKVKCKVDAPHIFFCIRNAVQEVDPARVKKLPTQIRPILNRNLSIQCEVQGFPIPRVSWFVDGFPIEEFRLNDSRYDAIDNPDGLPNSVLFISDVQYEDNREITCIADNVEGSDETRAQLAVRDDSNTQNFIKKSVNTRIASKQPHAVQETSMHSPKVTVSSDFTPIHRSPLLRLSLLQDQ
ncbi:ig-like domain-containing protein [Trichonephila inaurata madagascariensis]|uniref:Ig-like domain-containing protein n=1 Tax=Trichonephila inaurata madagascariensis TaxID=2747483 RepID=A0A8X6JSD7_9ARAC|nr:ig-like domain-containing protein [Trichonephila inaurata madagascariensis]